MTEGFYAVRLCEEISRDRTSTWFADHPQLVGCHAVGQTSDEAMAKLDDAREVWLAWAEKHGAPIPPPLADPSVLIQYATRPDASAPVDNFSMEPTTSIRVPTAA